MKDGNPPYLPQEIIRNILIRLPVKSLIRSQCVCKYWKNLFQTSSFIADHLRHSHQNSFLLYECYGKCDPHDECDPLHLCLVDREIRIRDIQNAPWIPSMTVVRIVNSNNGLLCVRFHGTIHSLLLCNLAIRDVKLVPEPPSHVGEQFYIGFGFNQIINDYKIARLRASSFDDPVDGCEVFSLSTGLWREIGVGNLEGVTMMIIDGFTVDGFIFWFGSRTGLLGDDENDRHHLIVSFDIAMEAFTLIPMPPIHFSYDTVFAVHENKLAVLYPDDRDAECCLIELWVMEENSNATEGTRRWSWTKKHTSKPYPCLLQPKTIWRNEIVCRVYPSLAEAEGDEVENVEIKTILINLTTNEFNIFSRHGFGPYHCIFNHVESLVPINNVPKEEP